MPQIFHRSTNTLSQGQHLRRRCSSSAAPLWLILEVNRSLLRDPRRTRRASSRCRSATRTTSAGIGLDCRYCHTSVESRPYAGIPPTKTCMNCHSQIWSQSPTLEPVRASFRTGTSIEWTKVHDLPDFVYFNHSAHVNKGVGCATCHGRVDQMPLMWQEKSLQMEWCLDCHRAARAVRAAEGRGLQHRLASRPPTSSSWDASS